MIKSSISAIALILVLSGAGHCYAIGLQNPASKNMTSEDRLRDALNEARAKKRRLTIKLRNGQVFAGKVSSISDKDFVLIPARHSGYVGAVPIAYGNVSTFKQQSAVGKTFDDIGNGALTVLKWTGLVAAGLAAAPVVIPLLVVAAILGHPLD